ncbi:hypothetical protein [Nocardia gipuzkoensis]
MSASLESLHYHVAEDPATGDDVSARSRESFPAGAAAAQFDAPALSFTSNEAAARFYLDQILRSDGRPALESLVEPNVPNGCRV